MDTFDYVSGTGTTALARAEGDGWKLELTGFSGGDTPSPWTLTNTGLAPGALTRLTIDLAPANCAFDRSTGNEGTSGSSTGSDFNLVSPDGVYVLEVTYINPIRIGEAVPDPFDLFTTLQVDFVGPAFPQPGNPPGNPGSPLEFTADADEATLVGIPPVALVVFLPNAGVPFRAASVDTVASGNDLDGAKVSVSGSINETVMFESTGGNSGATSEGSGWTLSLDGLSFDVDWKLAGDTLGPEILTGIAIDLADAGAAFDRSTPTPGTPGSSEGQDFLVAGTPGISEYHVRYLHSVGIGKKSPRGDLFTRMEIEFAVGSFEDGDVITFRADGDSVEALVPVVPTFPNMVFVVLVAALLIAIARIMMAPTARREQALR